MIDLTDIIRTPGAPISVWAQAINNSQSPAVDLASALEKVGADALCQAVIDLVRQADAMRQAMEAANDFFLHSPEWDFLFEPPFYEQFRQALAAALGDEPEQVYVRATLHKVNKL